MAKSPWRRATSWKLTPVPGAAAGKRTSHEQLVGAA